MVSIQSDYLFRSKGCSFHTLVPMHFPGGVLVFLLLHSSAIRGLRKSTKSTPNFMFIRYAQNCGKKYQSRSFAYSAMSFNASSMVLKPNCLCIIPSKNLFHMKPLEELGSLNINVGSVFLFFF